jgi:hypothetical protein
MAAEITILLVLAYLLPSFLAIVRGHQSRFEIVALDLLLGWTVLGWIFAFIWSLTAPCWENIAVSRERFRSEQDETEQLRRRFTPR